MASRLTLSLVSKRLSSVSAFSSAATAAAAVAVAAASASGNGATSPRSSSRQRKTGMPRIEAPSLGLRRSFSRLRSERDLRLELFFHIPGFSELQRLRVHRSLSLISLQAMLQREFAVPFEDQRLYFQGELLEGDEDLPFYELHDQSVINVRIRKRYRSIGDVFTKIRVVRFAADAAAPAALGNLGAVSGAAASKTLHLPPEDYELVEVVAALPPLRVVFRRLGIVIAYITTLDRMQLKRTNHRVWQQHAAHWGEPGSAFDTRRASGVGARRLTSQPVNPRALTMHLVTAAAQLPTPAGPVGSKVPSSSQQRASDDAVSFIMRKCSPERVSAAKSIAPATRERLQIAPEARSAADVRHIRKWLGSVKYFASASIPDAAFYEIAKSCVYEQYRAGDFIFRQGEVGDFFYILISGCVSLAAYGNGYFATMTPGMCFGEISLFEAKGVRTASANVNFAVPGGGAELAVLSGDVYRRVINPFKQAVLHRTEKAMYAVPQLRALPDHILTHVAYAGKSLIAKTGKRLIRHGDEVSVLVLLVAGEVKISTPQPARQRKDVNSGASARLKASLSTESTESTERSYPIVSVIRAPAVFGQESCLSNTPRPAPWDIDALDTCTLVCLRMDTISIFLAPQQDIIRALIAEHQLRVEAFRRRFEQFTAMQQSYRSSNMSGRCRQASYLRLLTSSRRLLVDGAATPPSTASDNSFLSPRQRAASRIEFPKVLLREDSVIATAAAAAASPAVHDIRSPQAPASPAHKATATNLRSFLFGSRRASRGQSQSEQSQSQQPQQATQAQTAPTCAELQDRFLHQALPFGDILELREQIQFVSFEQQQRDWDRQQQQQSRGSKRLDADQNEREHSEAKTQALLRGLRKLQAQDVELVVPPATRSHQPHTQFQFTPATPAVNT